MLQPGKDRPERCGYYPGSECWSLWHDATTYLVVRNVSSTVCCRISAVSRSSCLLCSVICLSTSLFVKCKGYSRSLKMSLLFRLIYLMSTFTTIRAIGNTAVLMSQYHPLTTSPHHSVNICPGCKSASSKFTFSFF